MRRLTESRVIGKRWRWCKDGQRANRTEGTWYFKWAEKRSESEIVNLPLGSTTMVRRHSEQPFRDHQPRTSRSLRPVPAGWQWCWTWQVVASLFLLKRADLEGDPSPWAEGHLLLEGPPSLKDEDLFEDEYPRSPALVWFHCAERECTWGWLQSLCP